MNGIPERIINEIKEADRVDSALFLKSDVKYLKMLERSEYIHLTKCSTLDTPVGYEDYCVSILKTID